ncbi:CstA-like transporter-associated (seleno)protein [Crenothrix sp.]|uniref:CstA-like transporter-associated (seleno)protein n=1 Tax=Crenothrix sp. TaxID=3100433 RepID=UPI00374DFBDE
MRGKIKLAWQTIRQLSGDDAYERYLQHYARYHQSHPECVYHAPLNKQAFFKQWQDEKWNGIKRCC